MIIGICGKSGSGKSTLANELTKKYNNAIHLDIDKIGHHVLTIESVKQKLTYTFGNNILKDNKINRKELSKIVFNSKKEMNKLTQITWEYMQIEIDKILTDNKNKIIILDWLLLPKTKYFNMCNIKILLDIPYEIRLERAIKRDNIKKESFELRESSSIEYNNECFDYVLKENEKIRKLVKLI